MSNQNESKRSWSIASMLTFFLLLAATVSAQQVPIRPTDTEWYFRYDLFELLLEKRGLEVSRFVNDAVLRPQESVVVLLGEQQKISDSTWSNLRTFIARGGHLLLATDRTPRSLGLTILDIGVVNPGPIMAQSAREQYNGFSDCVRVRNLEQDHRITSGVQEIVSNRSGWISKPMSARGSSNRWRAVAKLPERVEPTESQDQALIAIYEEPGPGSGSAVLVSDASLFTNSMLWHGDNALLAIRIADWLCASKRKTLVFMVDGAAMPSFAESMAKTPPTNNPARPPANVPKPTTTPDAKTLLQFANLVLQRVEDSNLLNEALRNQPRNLPLPIYHRWVWGAMALIVVTAIFLYWIRRMPWFTGFLNGRNMRSWYQIRSSMQHPLDRNSFAAECLARDFCRRWIGKDSLVHWKQYLQDMELDAGPIPINSAERACVKSIVEMAVYGKKSHFTDEQLLSISTTMKSLLLKLPDKSFT